MIEDMIEDMAIRKFAPKTQHDSVQRVKDFAALLGRSPDTAKSEDVRGFRLRLTSSRAGTSKINATVSALRFFFKVTLDRPDLTIAPTSPSTWFSCTSRARCRLF
jgi:integrase/recombinase XerD